MGRAGPVTQSREGLLRRSGRPPRFDVTFYMPWMGPLLQGGGAASPGGAETQVLMLARELARRGWRVAIICYQTDPPLPESVDGIEVFIEHSPRRLPRWLRRVSYLAEMARAVWHADASVYVQRTAATTTGYVGLLARLRRRRFVYSSSSVLDFDWRRSAAGPSPMHVWIYEQGLRLADPIVVQSPEQVALCRRRFGRLPILIKSMSPPADQRIAEPEAFLWAGRASAEKRPGAYVELARAVPEARFWIVAVPAGGMGADLIEELSAAATEVPNLELLPPRSRAELGDLLDRAVAAVNTSDYEGMPNVFLEAWARGVPALALSHDPDGVVAREGLGLFAEGSLNRLAQAARTMWRDRTNQSEMAARCRAYIAREHSPQPVVDAWESVLRLRADDARRPPPPNAESLVAALEPHA